MKLRAWDVVYGGVVVTLLGLAMIPVYIQAARGDWHDFDVFYNGAKAALAGASLYTSSGQYNLPFWYPPWIAWAFIPFALLTRSTGVLLYQIGSLVSALLMIHFLARYHYPKIGILDELFMLTMAIPMGFQVLIVGQMEFLFLALLVGIMFAAERKNYVLVAILYPFLLAKPHLVLLFTVFLFWRVGKRSLLLSLGLMALMLLAATLMRPTWYLEMLDILRRVGPRTDGLRFMTLAALLGRQENWMGTANLPFTVALFFIGLVLLWRVRALPTIPLLSLAAALSLLCAPRAYAYDLPMLIPAMIWLTAPRFRPRIWIWILAAVIPVLSRYESAAYILTVLICGLGMWNAFLQVSRPASQPSSLGQGLS